MELDLQDYGQQFEELMSDVIAHRFNSVHFMLDSNQYKDNLIRIFNEFAQSNHGEQQFFDCVYAVLVVLVPNCENSSVLLRTLCSILELVYAKNRDYGNSVFKCPCLIRSVSVSEAILVRLSDKVGRFKTLADGKCAEIAESLIDTLKDMVGYLFLYWVSVQLV